MSALVRVIEGEARTTSLAIAEAFGKQHKHVLRAADDIVKMRPDLEPNFGRKQMAVPIANGSKRMSRYLSINKNGFLILVMGFTGAKALDVRIAFVAEFERMEQVLREGVSDRVLQVATSQLLLNPLFATAEARDATSIALNAMRRIQHSSGSKAAYRLWLALGFPDVEAQVREDQAMLGAPVQPLGETYRWVEDRQVRVNPAAQAAGIDLWDDYAAWCRERGLAFLEPPAFLVGLRHLFGLPKYQRAFALEVGRADVP